VEDPVKIMDKRYGGATVAAVLPDSRAAWFLVTLVKSPHHLKPKQRGAARVLRLRRIGDQSVVPVQNGLLGVVRQIEHVLSVLPLDEPVPGVRVLGTESSQYAKRSGPVASNISESMNQGGGDGPPPNERTKVRSPRMSEESEEMILDLNSILKDIIRRLRPELGADEVEERAKRSAAKARPDQAKGLTSDERAALSAIKQKLEPTAR
jgi:ribosomal protein L30/L7E